jgi:hypothetical protein
MAFLVLSVFSLLLLSVNSSKSTTALTPVPTAEQQELNIPEIHQERSLTGKEKSTAFRAVKRFVTKKSLLLYS